MNAPPWMIGFVLVFVVSPIAIGAWRAASALFKARRMREAANAPLSQDACMACGSPDVEQIAPEVIRCRRCGFIAGDGVAAWQRQCRLHANEQLTPAARRTLALEKLRDARLNAESASSSLDDAVSASALDIAGLALDRGRDKQQALGSAAWHMRLAHQLTLEAAETLEAVLTLDAPFALEDNAVLLGLDTGWLTDGLAVDLAVHARIKRARVQLSALQEHIDALSKQLEVAPP